MQALKVAASLVPAIWNDYLFYLDSIRLSICAKFSKTMIYKTKINFACTNCLEIFDVEMVDIQFDKTGELLFNPIPECSFCGATEEVVLSNVGLVQIDHLMFNNEIRTIK